MICCRYFTHHNRGIFPMQGKYLIHIPITCKENMKLKITFHKVESRSFALGNFILIICKELLHIADTYFLYKHTLIIFPDWKNSNNQILCYVCSANFLFRFQNKPTKKFLFSHIVTKKSHPLTYLKYYKNINCKLAWKCKGNRTVHGVKLFSCWILGS